MLLELGADPNSQGEFKRSPLWRAAFLGKADLIPPLLCAGADPRLPNDAGELPQHVAATPAILELLLDWDVSRTEELVQARQKLRAAAEALVLEKQAAELKARRPPLAPSQNLSVCGDHAQPAGPASLSRPLIPVERANARELTNMGGCIISAWRWRISLPVPSASTQDVTEFADGGIGCRRRRERWQRRKRHTAARSGACSAPGPNWRSASTNMTRVWVRAVPTASPP